MSRKQNQNKFKRPFQILNRLVLIFWQAVLSVFGGIETLTNKQNQQKAYKRNLARLSRFGRSLFTAIMTLILTISLSGITLWFTLPAYAAGLYIEPITWDFIGLDSNNVNAGPNNFLLAARVCNTSGNTLNNINIQYVRTGAFNPYITVTAVNGINIDTISVTSLPSGPTPPNHQQIPNAGTGNMTPANCFDGYFNAVVTRTVDAYNTVQQYKIVASAAGAGFVDTNTALSSGISGYSYGQTVLQQLYVEKLISQARNDVVSFSGPSTVFVGQTIEYVLTTTTATAYPQLTVSSDFPNGILQLVDVKTTYTSDPSAVSSGIYYDGCGWLANPSNPGYHTSANTCAGPVANQDGNDGKVGNTVTTRYRVKVLSTGLAGGADNTISVNHLINDFSGGSFHYNADYGFDINSIIVRDSITDLQIVKSHTGNFATGNNTYQLQVANVGNTNVAAPPTATAARGTLTVVDTLPTGFTYVSGTGAGWTCSASGQVVTCTNPNTSDFAVGATSTISLTVNVSTSANSYSLNTATVTSPTRDSYLANNSSSDPTTVIKGTNLVLLKDDSVADPTEQTFVAGSPATYQLTVKNTSGSDALGPLTIIDTLPTGLSYSSSSGAGWTCSANGQNVTCTNPSGLTSGDGTTTGISTLSITVNVLSNVPTSVTNTASLTSGSLDTNPSDNTDRTQTNPTTKPVPDLIVSKTDNGQSFAVGQNGTYTITVTNALPGAAAATSGIITVTDTLPASFTYVSAASASGSSGWTCTNTTPVLGATVTCTNPNPLAINNSSSILLTVTPTIVTPVNGPPFTNNVSVALPAGEETTTTNNSGSDTTPVVAPSGINLSVVKKLTLIQVVPNPPAAPNPPCTTSGQVDTCTATINPNNTIQYTIDVTNNSSGNGDDTNITLTDTVPAEITGVTWTCDHVDQNNVAGSLPGQGGAATPENDLGTGNGDNICDPANTTGSPKYRKTGTGNNISLGTIALRKGGGKVRFTVNGTIAASGFSGNFSNSATATPSTGADSTIADNTYTVNATIQAADLSLTKTNLAPFTQGQNGIYRLTILNTGTPALPTTDLITVTDTLPVGLTYVSANSASGSSGWSCSYASATRLITCSNPTILASGATTQIDVTVTPTVTGSIINSATVTTEGDTNPDNNTGSVTITIAAPDPDVRITKTSGTLELGQAGTYTLQVDNIGTTTAIAPIVVTDTLPTGLSYVSGTGTGWVCSASGQTVTCTNYSNISAPINPATFVSAPALTLNVLVSTQAPSSITNNASVAQVTGESAGKLANNSTSLVSSVTQAADLAIVKSHTGNFVLGQSASYQLLVTNNGPSSVPSTITVTDPLPNDLAFVSSTGGGFTCNAAAKVNGTPQVVTCTNAAGLVVGTSATIALNVTVGASTPTGTNIITNTASVSSAVSDPVISNNSSSDPTTISPLQADLKLTKTHFGTFAIGGQGTYTLAVENLGPALATGTLTITDTLPPNLTLASFVGQGWNCTTIGSANVSCTNTNASGLASGSTTAVNITVTIGSGTPLGPNSITNTANLNVPSYDNVPANNIASDPTTISGSADLSVTKTSASTFTIAQQATYTITVSNSAISAMAAASPITLTDQLPNGLTYVSGSGTNWTCPTAPAGPDVECIYSNSIAINASSTPLTITVSVTNTLISPFTNFVSAFSPTPDPNTDNNTNQFTATLMAGAPNLNLVKRITAINGTPITGFVDDPGTTTDNDSKWQTPATYLRGAIVQNGVKSTDNVEYTIYFLSNGTENLKDVKICDRIPANTTFQIGTYDATVGSEKGILLGWDNTELANPTTSTGTGKVALTNNIADTDKGRFYSAGNTLPDPPCGTATNENGAVFVQVVSGTDTVPKAVSAGSPFNSYGFVRFNVKVN